MTDEIRFKKPKVGPIIEFVIDAIILVAVFNIAGGFFIDRGVPLQEQLTGLFLTIGVTGVALKYVLSTRIVK